MVKPGFVLTSMVKRVDNAVYQIVKDVIEKQFKAGLHVFGLESDGVGYVGRRVQQRSRCRPRRSAAAEEAKTEDHRRARSR